MFCGIDTHYFSDLNLHTFLVRPNHLIVVVVIFETTVLTQQNVKHTFMEASCGYKHLVNL